MYIRRWWLFSARSDTSRKTIRNVKVCAIVHFRAKKNKMWVLLLSLGPALLELGLGRTGAPCCPLSLVPCHHSDQRIANKACHGLAFARP